MCQSSRIRDGVFLHQRRNDRGHDRLTPGGLGQLGLRPMTNPQPKGARIEWIGVPLWQRIFGRSDTRRRYRHARSNPVHGYAGVRCSRRHPICGNDAGGHYDGNTVAALWTYAQHFALNDNSFGTMFGPSTPGALNLFAAQTAGANQHDLPNETIGGNVISDAEPQFDDCAKEPKITISNVRTIGDLLSERGLSWGWFQGGYRPTNSASENGGKARCEASHKNAAGADVRDYSPHHNPVAYYVQFKNSQHLPPTSVDIIGRSDQAMHQYDLDDFWRAVDNASMPAVSFLKARESQDGHAGYSGQLDEQRFLVESINRLQRSP